MNSPIAPSLTSAGFGENDQFRFRIAGDPGVECIVEASTNLVDWMTLATNGLLAVSLEVADAAASNHPARFYRTVIAN